jgi:hypothetical protein
VAGREIGEELVEQIVADLQARYALDDDDVRGLGTKLVGWAAAKGAPRMSRSLSASLLNTRRPSADWADSKRGCRHAQGGRRGTPRSHSRSRLSDRALP